MMHKVIHNFFPKIFLFLLLFKGIPNETGEIKAVILCDVIAEYIEKSVLSDLKNMQDALRKISNKTGVPLSLHTFSNSYLQKPFLAHINSLAIKEDDIVVFYFSGHGYRTESKKDNQWPNLYLTKDKKAIDFKEIYQMLKEKKPRLLIAFSDCCNNILPENCAPPLVSVHAFKSQKLFSIPLANYKRLFLKTKGTILISGAAPGEFSWATNNGGLFTHAFLRSISEEVNAPKLAHWKEILEKASLTIRNRNIGQNPQFVLDINEE